VPNENINQTNKDDIDGLSGKPSDQSNKLNEILNKKRQRLDSNGDMETDSTPFANVLSSEGD
jgi:hypothetical protein